MNAVTTIQSGVWIMSKFYPRRTIPLTGSLFAICLMVGMTCKGISADSNVNQRGAVFTSFRTGSLQSPNLTSNSNGIIAPRDVWSDVNNTVSNIVHTITDIVGDVSVQTWSIVPGTVSDYYKYVLSRPVTIRNEIGNFLQGGYKSMLDHRPEWFIEPPPWLADVSQSLGVNIDTINTTVNVGVAIGHGDLTWTDQFKAQVAIAIVNEGIAQAENYTLGAATTAAPQFAIYIDPAIAYGFDKAEDRIDNKISQHYASGGSGQQEVDSLQSGSQPIQVHLSAGTVIPSAVIANGIKLGDLASSVMTVIVPLDGGIHPSYMVSVGGDIVVTGETVIIDSVLIIAVPSNSAIPTEVTNYINDISTRAPQTSTWTDNIYSQGNG